MFPFDAIRRAFKRPPRPAGFTLGERGEPGIPGGREDVVRGHREERPPFSTGAARRKGEGLWGSVRSTAGGRSRPRSQEIALRSPFGGMTESEREQLEGRLYKSLDQNISTVMNIFHAPRNSDLTVREFKIKWRGGYKRAACLFIEGLSDPEAISRHVLASLLSVDPGREKGATDTRSLAEKVLSGTSLDFADRFSQVAAAIVEGETVLFVDGDDWAAIPGTRNPEHRAIDESPTEAVIRGPHEGFVENYRTNVTMIRLLLETPQLVTERLYVGAGSRRPFGMMYLEGVVNPKLVDEVRRRILSIESDVVMTAAMLERLIEDEPYNPYPTVLITERPDRVASMLAEGHVAIVDGSPGVAIVPVTLWSLMQTSEDYYVHFATASYMRLIRWGALISTLYSSALYVAIATFHPEMIPTELLFSIAAAREAVPFPAALEVLVMEAAFELIREAGIRIPTIIGPTIGIVGAVILGQAAVTASVVSPVLVVVVAVSGLGSFVIPNYELGLLLRIGKFAMILAAAALGLPGVTVLSMFLLTRLCIMRSFGVPVLAPVLPSWRHSPDTLLRGPDWMMERRPQTARPLDEDRQQPRARPGKPGEPVRRGRDPGWRARR
ncbi:MAG: spore germination protein [Ignavibacteriales bacterium]